MVNYTYASNPNSLTVAWRVGSATPVCYRGTEDEAWDYTDAFPRVRGLNFYAPSNAAQSS